MAHITPNQNEGTKRLLRDIFGDQTMHLSVDSMTDVTSTSDGIEAHIKPQWISVEEAENFALDEQNEFRKQMLAKYGDMPEID